MDKPRQHLKKYRRRYKVLRIRNTDDPLDDDYELVVGFEPAKHGVAMTVWLYSDDELAALLPTRVGNRLVRQQRARRIASTEDGVVIAFPETKLHELADDLRLIRRPRRKAKPKKDKAQAKAQPKKAARPKSAPKRKAAATKPAAPGATQPAAATGQQSSNQEEAVRKRKVTEAVAGKRPAAPSEQVPSHATSKGGSHSADAKQASKRATDQLAFSF